MSVDPVKIPQNVYIEDRVVGPLTLRQTLIMAISGGVSYALYSSIVKAYGGNPGIVITVACWLPFVFGTLFAIVKINDLSLTRLLFLMIERTQKPPRRTFGPRRGITITVRTADSKTIQERNKQLLQEEMATKQAQKKISELSAIVDSAFANEDSSAVAGEPAAEAETSGAAVPVEKNRITVDGPADPSTPRISTPELTDLSAFRDPPPAPLHG